MEIAAGEVSPALQVVSDRFPSHSWTFKFRSNALSLNFAASMAGPNSRPFGVERLTEPALLEEWIHLAELPAPAAPLTHAELADAIDLREALFRVSTVEKDGTTPAEGDIATINKWAALVPAIPQLSANARSLTVEASAPFAQILSVIATDAIAVFTGPHRHRIRECASEKCPILFVDTSRAGNRRWCAERPCGFQASARAYRNRSRSSAAG